MIENHAINKTGTGNIPDPARKTGFNDKNSNSVYMRVVLNMIFRLIWP